MKRIILLIFIFKICVVTAQEYSFIADSLKLISPTELRKKPPPADMNLVYYEDGTKTTFQEVFPLIRQQKMVPHMFVDSNGNYIALVVAKAKIKSEDIYIRYNKMPDSLKRLGYSYGNPNSDTVLIVAQGGPQTELMTDNFRSIFKDAGIDEESYFTINAHQKQTLYPAFFKKEEISFEQAKGYATETSQIMYDLVRFFKSENKKVYIVGISFGAFAGANFLAEYGNVADGYLLMVGRLDMNEEVWQAYSKGIYAGFKEDASTTFTGEKTKDITLVNMRKLAAGFGYNRYSNRLQEIDLSNLSYFYGKNDNVVGKLTASEIQFLDSKNANVVGFDGAHGVWAERLKEGLNMLLNK